MHGDTYSALQPIGDVQSLYDGQLLPELQVQTLRNAHRLFPTRAVSLRHLLTMTSGVAWNETYTDPASDRRKVLRAQLAQQGGAILRQMAALPRAHAPGAQFSALPKPMGLWGIPAEAFFGAVVEALQG